MPLIQLRSQNSRTAPGLSEFVNTRQVEIAYRNLPLALSVVLLNTLIFTVVFWNVTDRVTMTAWSGAQLLSIAWRLLEARRFEKERSRHTLAVWKGRLLLGIGLSALLWGMAALVLFPVGLPLYQSFLMILFAGMSAGGVSSLASVRYASQFFASMLILPLLYVVWTQPGEVYTALGLLIVFYWGLLLIIAGRIYDNIHTSLVSGMLHERALVDLKLTEEHFQTIFKEAPGGIFYYDKELRVLDANEAMMNILRIGSAKMIGLDMKTLADTRIFDALNAPARGENGYYEGPYSSTFQNLGLWVILRTSPVYDEQRAIVGGVGIVTDITERIAAEETVKRQAYFDALTDIPNRILLKDRIDQALAHFRRHGRYGAVLFLDLDHFKSVNDSLGHMVGDEMLIETAKRLSRSCREDDTVARLGGDEFVVLLTDLGSDPNAAATGAEAVAEKIHTVLGYPYELDGGERVSSSSSIGIALINDAEQSADDLLKFADLAMYQAKKEGRGTTRFYQAQMDQWIKKRLMLENALRSAVANRELSLHYQPVVETETGRIVGAEALLRWNHPTLGMILPDEIIGIAEESKLIVPVGEWVFEEACRQFVEWKTTHPRAIQLKRIAINVSAVQFRQAGFADAVVRIVTETGISPAMVEIELTESTVIDGIEAVIETMQRLRTFGVSLSMDDFGTGYSSLAYLKRLPFSTLKIDRSFVRDIMTDRDDAALVQTILSMASIFALNVIAEGVETDDQLAFLRGHGCRLYQGYWCSPPLPAEEYAALLAASN